MKEFRKIRNNVIIYQEKTRKNEGAGKGQHMII